MCPDLRISNVEQPNLVREPPGAAEVVQSAAAFLGENNTHCIGTTNKIEAASFNDTADADLVQSALSAIQRHPLVAAANVRPVVRNGWLILEGEVQGQAQRLAAEDAVRGLDGIHGVSNNIRIESEAIAQRVSQKIDETFVRNARLSAHGISVTATDHKIILSGCVRSALEREHAEAAAWEVPGVAQVVNRIRLTS